MEQLVFLISWMTKEFRGGVSNFKKNIVNQFSCHFRQFETTMIFFSRLEFISCPYFVKIHCHFSSKYFFGSVIKKYKCSKLQEMARNDFWVFRFWVFLRFCMLWCSIFDRFGAGKMFSTKKGGKMLPGREWCNIT